MIDIEERLAELAVVLADAKLQYPDLKEVRHDLYMLRIEAWAIIAEIDRRRMIEWEAEQAAKPSLRLEDIGL